MNDLIKGGKRPKGMSYGQYKAACVKKGDDPVDEDEYNKLEEEETEKSLGSEVDGDALLKSIQAYEDAEAGLTSSREDELMGKLQKGETLAPDERMELAALMGGTTAAGEPMRKSLGEQIGDGDGGPLLDASAFLSDLVDSLEKSLTDVTDSVALDHAQTRQLFKAQGSLLRDVARHNVQLGNMVKSLTDRLERVETTPGAPRAVRTDRPAIRRPMAKSAAGDPGDPNGNQLTKAQVKTGIRTLMAKADEQGDDRALEVLNLASAQFESTHTLPPRVTAAIRHELAR